MSEAIRRVFCWTNTSDPACRRAAVKLEEMLAAAGFELLGEFPAAGPPPDVVVILGGDGFLMESLQRFGYPAVRVFGVNFGTVGFHMNPPGCLEQIAVLLSGGRFVAESCPVLEALAIGEDGSETVLHAFNDFFVERQTRQSVRIRLSVDGLFFNRLAGDGIVVATAVGSTAYNLAAGGPAVHPRVEGLVVTPLCPHRASPFHSLQFSVMLPLESSIDLEAEDLPKRRMRLVADGRSFAAVARVTVRDSGRRITLLRAVGHSYLETLARKFTGSSPE